MLVLEATKSTNTLELVAVSGGSVAVKRFVANGVFTKILVAVAVQFALKLLFVGEIAAKNRLLVCQRTRTR